MSVISTRRARVCCGAGPARDLKCEPDSARIKKATPMTTPAAPTRDIIVPSFQPGRMRAAAHKGRHAGRTEQAGFFTFCNTAVAPQRGHRQKRSDEPGLAGCRGRQPLLSHREIFGRCSARERTAPATSRQHRGAAIALWRRFRGANNAREDELQNACTTPSASSPLSGLERCPTTLAVAIEHRLTNEILSST